MFQSFLNFSITFSDFFSSIGARGSRAQICHRKKIELYRCNFKNFLVYYMRNSYVKGVGTHLINSKILLLDGQLEVGYQSSAYQCFNLFLICQ